MAEFTKKEITAAYSRGYQAGRKSSGNSTLNEFRNRAFLAALPACISAQGWERTINNKKKHISTLPERVKLAWEFADEAQKDFTP